VASRASSHGVKPIAPIAAALLAGLAGLPAIATGRFLPGLLFLFLSRAAAMIGTVSAGARDRRVATAFDAIFFASVPFAFALHDPATGLTASLLLFGMIAAGAASLFARGDGRIAVPDQALLLAAFALACVRPDWFSLIAYLLALLCFIAAGMRVALAMMRSGA
jgi:hypothetical protein